ncbi:hypothetical protein WA577_003585, partial [Blastocystis sp. JDR]
LSLAFSTALLTLGLVVFIILVIKRVLSTSSIDEEMEEYESLLKKREKHGIEMSAPSISQNSNPIPIVTEQEVAAASVSIPVDPNMDKSLSDEELLKDAEESDNSV